MEHTTLSIEKSIYNKSAKRAKKQHLSVSAIARMLLEAYAEGRINIMTIQIDPPVELYELSENEITPEIKKMAEEAYKTPKSKLINIPV